jgi:putative methionine-R-sulfoxide reductase with GAF domain
MPPRTLESLAHALGAAPDVHAALVALGESLAEIDRAAAVALVRHDARTTLFTETLTPNSGRVSRNQVELALGFLPASLADKLTTAAEFVDAGERSAELAQLFALPAIARGGSLALKGLRFDGALYGVIACSEPARVFGTRAVEQFAPAVALFEIALQRCVESESRAEAVRALEDVTRRLHTEHMAKLSQLEAALLEARQNATPSSTASLTAERERERLAEGARRATQRASALEKQLAAGTAQLEQAHVELHRRSELLRQRSRTLYLLERVLTLAVSAGEPRKLAEGLLALVGDDLQAQRCSLFLRAPEPETLYLAAARGLAPHIRLGQRVRVGEGVAGRVAATREPLLVVDVADAAAQPLLRDEYLTTGSFISFPLVLHDEVIGVVNVTNRARQGLFVDDDVERVRLLAMVVALAASQAQLATRLMGVIDNA